MTTTKEPSIYAEYAEAFSIIDKYRTEEDGYGHVAVEHDEMFAGSVPEGTEVSPTGLARLEELGWYINEGLECFHKFV